jgi:DNA-binding transcriptional regulator YiaG
MSAHNVRNMSDLYVELRTRIPVVAEQTVLGSQRIDEAQKRAALSNEAVARLVPVSEKTWRRWKQRGAIPTASLPAVARALRLDLFELAPRGQMEPEPGLRELQDHLDRQHDEVMRRLDRIEEIARAGAIAAAAAADRS